MNKIVKPQHVIGLLAIVIGAVATLDTTLLPVIRYLGIYVSLIVLAVLLLMDAYQSVDDSPTLEKIKDER